MVEKLLDHPVPVLLSLDDLDLDSQVADGNLLVQQAGHPHRVLLRGEDAGDAAACAALDEAVEFPLRVAVMICKTLGQLQRDTESPESLLEAFR